MKKKISFFIISSSLIFGSFQAEAGRKFNGDWEFIEDARRNQVYKKKEDSKPQYFLKRGQVISPTTALFFSLLFLSPYFAPGVAAARYNNDALDDQRWAANQLDRVYGGVFTQAVDREQTAWRAIRDDD